MDLPENIHNIIKRQRQERLAVSDQLTLGELILKLENVLNRNKEDREAEIPNVVYDFGYLFPNDIDSWRGSYDELALNYTKEGDRMKLDEFISMLKGCIGKTFTGYKGGDFQMSRLTPIWVANYGDSGNTAVIDIIDDGWQVVICTGYREY